MKKRRTNLPPNRSNAQLVLRQTKRSSPTLVLPQPLAGVPSKNDAKSVCKMGKVLSFKELSDLLDSMISSGGMSNSADLMQLRPIAQCPYTPLQKQILLEKTAKYMQMSMSGTATENRKKGDKEVHTIKQSMNLQCFHFLCDKQEGLKKCGGCRRVSCMFLLALISRNEHNPDCSSECQKKDHSIHKHFCKASKACVINGALAVGRAQAQSLSKDEKTRKQNVIAAQNSDKYLLMSLVEKNGGVWNGAFEDLVMNERRCLECFITPTALQMKNEPDRFVHCQECGVAAYCSSEHLASNKHKHQTEYTSLAKTHCQLFKESAEQSEKERFVSRHYAAKSLIIA